MCKDSGDTTTCKVTPVILHGAVSSGDATPCSMTGVTLHRLVFLVRVEAGGGTDLAMV